MIIVGYVLGAPIFRESLQFRLAECIPGENESLSQYVLEITNFNGTCIKVKKSPTQENPEYFYEPSKTETGAQIRIITKNCSTPLSNLHLSLCDDDDDDQSDDNSTEIMITYAFNNMSNIDALDVYDNNETSTIETLNTGPTVYETLHNLNQDSDEEKNNIINTPSTDLKPDQSSEIDDDDDD